MNKKRKNGFTLVEIIAVIVILAIITVIATVSFTAVRKKNLQKNYDSLVQNIEIAAEKYAADRMLSGDKAITVADLIKEGYIETNKDGQVVDPRSNKNLNGINVCIAKNKNTSKFEATYNSSCANSGCNIPYNQSATEYIKQLYNCDSNGMAYDATTDNNLRYIGSTPNNYVTFNNELWRIIGVMNNVDNGTGKKESRIKLIREDTLNGTFSWDLKQNGVGSGSSTYLNGTDAYGSNDWSDSQLMMMLNPADVVKANWQNQETKKSYTISNGNAIDGNNHIIYKGVGSYFERKQGYKPVETPKSGFPTQSTDIDFTNNGLTNESKNLIDKTKYNLGGIVLGDNETATARIYYTKERGNQVYRTNPVTWTGYIGLMYASDYGFATSGGEKKSRSECLSTAILNWNYSSETRDCKNNDWLYDAKHDQWTLNPYAASGKQVAEVYMDGLLDPLSTAPNTNSVKPVLYLKSNVKITNGEGTKSNPYKLSL